MIGDRILQYPDLQELCRAGEKPRLATVAKWAEDAGIKYKFDGKGGIWTTIGALESALGITAAANDSPYDAAELFGRE